MLRKAAAATFGAIRAHHHAPRSMMARSALAFSTDVTGKDPVKETTGLTGLDVVPNARRVLSSLYGAILEEAARIPSENAYRDDIERLTKYRLSVVESTESISAIEAEINDGQIEELVASAEAELELLPRFAGWVGEGAPLEADADRKQIRQ